MTDKFSEVIGCIHIHSTYSDGTGTVEDIARFAGEVGLNFILLTDHNNLRAMHDGKQGWHQNVLALIGYEINDIDNTNHYLAFGLSEELNKNLPAQEYVKRVKYKGGFGIIAHPDEERHLLPEHPPYPWTAWDSQDYQGIEIWNQMSEWMEGLTPWNKLWRFINPRRSIIAPVSQTLKRWDDVNLQRKVMGIGGVDAHAHKHKMLAGLIYVTVFHYKIQFKSVRTHLLLDKPLIPGMPLEEAKQLIFNAMLECRIFISNFFNGDARGSQFFASNKNGITTIGQKLDYAANTRLEINLPLNGEKNIIKDGRQICQLNKNNSTFKINEPGLYRIEVFRKGRSLIYTNHIRIVDEK